ncbi:MAG: NADPH:quinone oxidoreductase [Pusillimonas sp.]|nr:NADPH:quinone oxidoreductase [Pusillimonas sp.]MBC41358.1 NADPH:quinone oxidoreductase [Pusillimonas sp.]HCP77554.1 NADPH:quinone reductase [Pusillimonas sp.]|tara:strand:+ start:97598 stop:98575 length:978 start_codon:yes stop_codon:yes gene_type:complete
MKAVWYCRNGAAREVLEYGELPDPEPGIGEVRVRLHASGINPSDVKFRLRRPLDFDQIVPHSDGAGMIDYVGPGVGSHRVGQRVWVWNAQWRRPWGTACEYVVLPEIQAVPLPDTMSFEQGACLGIPALTAVQSVRLAGPLAGKTILVTGAGSAVGHYVTQMAVLEGARVIGTAGSGARREDAEQAGAFSVVDYKQTAVGARVLELTQGEGVDAIIDMDFSSTAALLSENVLKTHGVYVCYGSNTAGVLPVDVRALLWRSIDLRCFLVYDLLPDDRAVCIEKLSGWLEQGRLQHRVAKTFRLRQAAAAHEFVESGAKRGTAILRI